MNRITYIKIGEKNYPMSFSLGASKRIAQKFGSIDKVADAIIGADGVTEKTIDSIVFLTTILISQGCAYKNFFEADLPVEKDAPVNSEGKYIALTEEEIEVAIGLLDLGEVSTKLFEAMGKSDSTEVKAEDEKKTETKQAKKA